jgi:hypothetical protein
MNNFTDFLAGLTIQIGNYYKIKKNRIGWLLSICAIIYWIMRANTTGFYSQCFWHLFSLTMAIYGYCKWK